MHSSLLHIFIECRSSVFYSPLASRSLHTAEDAVDTKWVTQQWIARGLQNAAVDPIAAALAGSLPATASSTAAPPARQQQRREESERLSAAEALLAGKRGKGKAKKAGSKKAGGGKGFGG
jgi:collagen type III alpha